MEMLQIILHIIQITVENLHKQPYAGIEKKFGYETKCKLVLKKVQRKMRICILFVPL